MSDALDTIKTIKALRRRIREVEIRVERIRDDVADSEKSFKDMGILDDLDGRRSSIKDDIAEWDDQIHVIEKALEGFADSGSVQALGCSHRSGESWSNLVSRIEGIKSQVDRDVSQTREAAEDAKAASEDYVEAREVANAAHTATQEEIKEFIEDVVTLALHTVYGDQYEFHLECSIKRNKAEMAPVLVKNGKEYDLKDSIGVGPVDLMAFAMRLARWAMSSNRTSPVFVIDEPFTAVDRSRTDGIVAFLNKMVDMLGVQLIIVTHDQWLVNAADRVFEVRYERGKSLVETVGGTE